MIDLSLVWAAIIGFAVIMYVILDGFDLGIGIIFPFVKNNTHKDVMMHSIAPFWDGNETWLVLGGTGIFAAFPKAYSTLLPILYLPLIIFLLALIMRGVAFEFRFKATTHQYIWDYSFFFGSIIATFMQGVVLGAFIEGFTIKNGIYLGKEYGWLTPFSIMTGIALICGYSLLGSTWLILKTENDLQDWCRNIALKLMCLVLFFILIVSIWTPFIHQDIAKRWFSWPNIIYFLPVPAHTMGLAIILYLSIIKKREILPFISSIGLFILSYTGLIISLYPFIIPRYMTIWQASSPPESQLFALTGVLFLLPIILGYTFHAYWVFRGKVHLNDGY
jgi:cytochrome d ubiquinol oxidase subunit II